MHLCMCYHWLARPWTIWISILHLSARTFSGLVGKDNYPPICLHPPSSTVEIYPFVFFTRCIPNTLALQKNVEDFAPLLRVPLSIVFLALSGGGSKVVGEISLIIFARSGLFVPSNILRSICSCCQVVRSSVHLFGGAHVGYFLATWYDRPFRGSLLTKGIWNSFRDCFAPAHNVPGSLHIAFWFLCLIKDKVCTGLFSSLLRGFWCSFISLYSVRRRG